MPVPLRRREEVAPSDSSQHAVGRQHSKIGRGDPKALTEKLSAVRTAWGNNLPACGQLAPQVTRNQKAGKGCYCFNL